MTLQKINARKVGKDGERNRNVFDSRQPIMRYRHTIKLLGACLPICLILRTLQLIFTVDSATGFIKQQFSGISVTIMVVIFAAIVSVGVLGFAADGVKIQKAQKNIFLAASAFLVGCMFIYDTVASLQTQNITAWYDIVTVFLGLITAAVFFAFGVKNIYDIKFPHIFLVVPVFYYILRIITVFVSTSALALVTKNIFLIFTNGILLFFMFEFAKFENNIDEKPKLRKFFASGIMAVMLCFTESLPKFISQTDIMSDRDIADGILTLTMGAFVLTYILSNFADKHSLENTHTAKHLAE